LTQEYVIAELPTPLTLIAYQTYANPDYTLIELRCLSHQRTEPLPIEILLTLQYLNKIK